MVKKYGIIVLVALINMANAMEQEHGANALRNRRLQTEHEQFVELVEYKTHHMLANKEEFTQKLVTQFGSLAKAVEGLKKYKEELKDDMQQAQSWYCFPISCCTSDVPSMLQTLAGVTCLYSISDNISVETVVPLFILQQFARPFFDFAQYEIQNKEQAVRRYTKDLELVERELTFAQQELERPIAMKME